MVSLDGSNGQFLFQNGNGSLHVFIALCLYAF